MTSLNNPPSMQPANPFSTAPPINPAQRTFKTVQRGELVVLGDEFLSEHDQLMRMENIASDTLKDAEDMSRALIESAEAEAERIIEEAKLFAESQIESILEVGRQQGFEAGRQEGIEQGLNEIAVNIDTGQQLIEQTVLGQQALLSQQKTLFVTVLQQVLETLFGNLLQYSPQALGALIETALQRFEHHGHIKLLIHPDRMALLTQYDGLQALLENHHRVQLVPHHRCPPHQIILEAAETSFDLSPATLVQQALLVLEPQLEASLSAIESTPMDATPTYKVLLDQDPTATIHEADLQDATESGEVTTAFEALDSLPETTDDLEPSTTQVYEAMEPEVVVWSPPALDALPELDPMAVAVDDIDPILTEPEPTPVIVDTPNVLETPLDTSPDWAESSIGGIQDDTVGVLDSFESSTNDDEDDDNDGLFIVGDPFHS